jgi:hypothetical protein
VTNPSQQLSAELPRAESSGGDGPGQARQGQHMTEMYVSDLGFTTSLSSRVGIGGLAYSGGDGLHEPAYNVCCHSLPIADWVAKRYNAGTKYCRPENSAGLLLCQKEGSSVLPIAEGHSCHYWHGCRDVAADLKGER